VDSHSLRTPKLKGVSAQELTCCKPNLSSQALEGLEPSHSSPQELYQPRSRNLLVEVCSVLSLHLAVVFSVKHNHRPRANTHHSKTQEHPPRVDSLAKVVKPLSKLVAVVCLASNNLASSRWVHHKVSADRANSNSHPLVRASALVQELNLPVKEASVNLSKHRAASSSLNLRCSSSSKYCDLKAACLMHLKAVAKGNQMDFSPAEILQNNESRKENQDFQADYDFY